MKVSKIVRKNYMTPGEHTLELPEQGLVVITGTNGCGKSSWIDAVGAVWNKQVRNPKDRKSHGNLPDLPAKVEVNSYKKLKVKRNWTAGGKASLAWEITGDHVDSSTTKSKGQGALEAEIGDYKPWRWSCLISSQSTDTFSRATSANRRAILEDVLDLDLLARAHKKIHEEASSLKKQLAVKDAEIAQKAQQMQLAHQARQAAEQAYLALKPPVMPPEPSEPIMPPLPSAPQKPVLTLPGQPQPLPIPTPPELPESVDVGALKARLAEQEEEKAVLEQELVGLKQDYQEITKTLQRSQERIAQHKAAFENAQRQCQLMESGHCPTCEQEISARTGKAYEITRDSEEGLLEQAQLAMQMAEALRDGNVQNGKARKAKLEALAVELLKTKADIDSADRVAQHREHLLSSHRKAVVAHSQQQAQQLAAYEQQCQQVTQQHQVRLAQAEQHWQDTLRLHSKHVETLQQQYQEARVTWEEHCKTATTRHEEAKGAAQVALDAAKSALQDVEKEHEEMCSAAVVMRDDYELRTEALSILGPSGVRAEILDNAMLGVTQEANAVLAELETDVRVRLFAEGKDVGLETKGGRGPRYEDLSNGEQHRVDFALLRGLGRVAAALRGQRDDGTLFIDEALDGIDENGLDAVCEYIQAVSASRCVVVITHRAEVLTRLRPVKRVEMVDSRKSKKTKIEELLA